MRRSWPRRTLAGAGFLWFIVTAAAKTIPPNSKFEVELLEPLSTQTNRKGDQITASVVSPEAFKGDTVEGQIKKSKSGGKVKGKSVLIFTFWQIHHDGRPIQISSQVESVTNSQGKVNVDDEGRVIKGKNSLGKVAAATGIGAAIGAIAGGGEGAAIGAGVGAAAALIFIEVGTEGPNITFARGSRLRLNVKER